ncbi:MAG: phosphoribosylformylglycinamidine cyclo-ligase [Chitinispirillaceae bacterium]|nr:phosphoribosylformylglycinamidine cyclo-ligase [Chitinispirillaceae bacterium]
MIESLRYLDGGVDVGVWNSVKGSIGEFVASTFNDRVLGKFGQFGGMFDITGLEGYERPVLVSSTDSVGTKVMIAFETGNHSTVGYDIVNHCVNDILVMGAKPLFFLDYIGIYKLLPDVANKIVGGLATACRQNGCVLIGGETAEMPDLYKKGEYDLVGAIVGLVDRDKVIDGSAIVPGDLLIGLRSSGLHTNGYSLARKIVREIGGRNYDDEFEGSGKTFGQVLQEPHRSYFPLHAYLQGSLVKGCAHITGGGFQDNADRMLPPSCDAVIELATWQPDPIFTWLQKTGNVERDEMYHTFNMGIGMVVAVAPEDRDALLTASELRQFEPRRIGRIIAGTGRVALE